MKKITLLAAVLFCTAFAANAQVSKGSLFVGGGLGFNSESDKVTVGPTTVESPKMSSWHFSPMAGYFLTNNIAAGLMLDFGGSTTTIATTPDETEIKTKGMGFGIFGRYYAPINDKFYFWGQLGLMFGSGSTETKIGAVTTVNAKTSMMDVSLSPGFTFFPSTRYGLDFSVGRLGISNTTVENPGAATQPNETKTSEFGLNWDMTAVTIGVHIFFGGGGGGGAQ